MPSWILGGLAVVLKAILQILGAVLWPTGLPRANIIMFWALDGPSLGASWGQLGPNLGLSECILGHVGQFWNPPGGPGRASLGRTQAWKHGLESYMWQEGRVPNTC